MKPPIPLLISTALISAIVQGRAIAQVLACRSPISSVNTSTRDCFPRFGKTNQGTYLRLDACSLNGTGNGMEFIYLLDGNPVRGWTNCLDRGWLVGDRYVPAGSAAAISMLNFICSQRTNNVR